MSQANYAKVSSVDLGLSSACLACAAAAGGVLAHRHSRPPPAWTLSTSRSPPDATPGHRARRIGAATEIRLGGYESMEPAAFRQASILGRIAPRPPGHLGPKRRYREPAGMSWHYAHRSGIKGDINYVLQAASSPIPEGMKLLAAEGDAALYVKDRAVLAQHRAPPPRRPGVRST